MSNREQWTREWSAQIGENLFRERRAAGVTRLELEKRATRLGRPISRQTIAKTEEGLKASVGTDEVAVYALALGVPQSRLMFEPGGSVPVGPGLHVTASVAERGFVDGLSVAEVLAGNKS